MIRVENVEFKFADYHKFSLATLFGDKLKVLVLCHWVLALVLFAVKVFLIPIDLSLVRLLIDIFSGAAMLTFVFFIYFSIASFWNYKSYRHRGPAVMEFHEDHILSNSEGEKINLPKEKIKRVILKSDAAYVFYLNKALLILRSYFKDNTEWEKARDFIRENYVGAGARAEENQEKKWNTQ